MTYHLPNSIVNITVFGSYGRGDFDADSDVDVLVLVKDGSGTTPERVVADAIMPLLPDTPSVSFYGERKLRTMFAEGHLFAWHLYLESRSLCGFKELSVEFEEPSPYISALSDVAGLLDILNSVETNIDLSPQNSVFEMGIIYVCARNVAMSASWSLAGRPDFSRYSPYSIPDIGFPMSREVYDKAMQCRMASTRGRRPPEVTPQLVRTTASGITAWGASVLERLRSGQ